METRIQENARKMEAKMQNIEQRLHSVDELQETVLGFRNEIQIMGRTFRQEIQAMALEIRNIAHSPTYEKPITELTHLRQTGTLKEFNVKFDTLAARLDLPEAYLVDVYVGALREEIADSVRFFNPRTLVEAQRMARVQEISLLWRSKKMVLSIKNEQQGKFPEPQEHIAMQEEVKEMQEPSSQDPSFCSEQRFCSSNFSKTEVGCAEGRNSRKVYPTSVLLPLGSSSSPRFVTSGCGMFPPPFIDSSLEFIAVPLPFMSLSLQVERRQQVQLPRNERIGRSHVGSYNTLSKPAPSTITTASSTLMVAILRELLSFFPLLLFLFGSRVQKTLQSEDTAQPSKNTVQPAEGAWKFTWLQKFQCERSNLQLASISFKLQQCFQGFTETCHTQWASGFSWNSGEDSPISLQSCFTISLGVNNDELFQKWASLLNFSPTRILMLEWFKGELITMLCGRICSLSREKRRK